MLQNTCICWKYSQVLILSILTISESELPLKKKVPYNTEQNQLNTQVNYPVVIIIIIIVVVIIIIIVIIYLFSEHV